jgi:LysR family glycine cleavage system transcriptional activator
VNAVPEIDWLHLPALSSLRAFEATARLNGFSAAARALNVTPAAVAQQVRGLETELGVALVLREGRGLALTQAGQQLATALGDGFGTIAKGVQDLRRSDRNRGLRVTATVAFSQSVLMPRLPRFWADHPGIPVSLTPTQTPVDLLRDGYDLAIRTGRGDWPGVRAEFLFRTEMIVVGAPSVVRQSDDLSTLPWIVDGHYTPEDDWLRLGGLDPETIRIHSMENPILSVTAAEAGMGLIFATDAVVADSLAAGRLERVPYPPLPETTYWMVTPPGPQRAAVTAFADWLRAEIGGPVSD